MQDGSFENVIWSDFILFAGNGVLVLLSYPVIFLFEKKFLFLSDTTLLELADTNQPLLRKLAEEAPGSFPAFTAGCKSCRRGSKSYGANLLLVRTGAFIMISGKLLIQNILLKISLMIIVLMIILILLRVLKLL